MEIRVLRYFLAVAREESITGAAEVLHVTQPTLSKQLMELEETLGKKLFIRGKRKITLTEEGVFLRKRAQEIVDLVDKTTSDFADDDEMLSGDVYIGGGETDAMRFIARTIRNIHKNYPHIHFHLYSGNGDDVSERLDKGLLDFGIMIEPCDLKKYDYLSLPAQDTWGLLMRKDSPLAKNPYVTAKDIEDIPLFCSRQTLVRNEISGWSGRDFEKLNIIGTYNLIYNAALTVSEGVGYALTLDKLADISAESPLTFRPLHPPLKAGLNIVWKKYQIFSKSAKIFLDELQKELS